MEKDTVKIYLKERIDEREHISRRGGKCHIVTYIAEIEKDGERNAPEPVDVWDWKQETQEGDVWIAIYNPPSTKDYNANIYLTQKVQEQLPQKKKEQEESDLARRREALNLITQLLSGPRPLPSIQQLEEYYQFFLGKLQEKKGGSDEKTHN